MSDSGGKALGYSAVGFGIGLFLFFRSFKSFREMRLIKNTPTSKIRSLAMGRVEVYGSIVLNQAEETTAPFSGKKCAYCTWKIEEYRSSGKSSRWVTVRSGTEGRHFYVKDNTGTVLVDTHGAKVDTKHDLVAKKLTPAIRTYMDKIKYNPKGLIFNKSIRLTEWRLDKDDVVYVMGNAGDNPYVEDGSSTKNELDIMIQKKGKQFFYISDRPEKDVLQSYGWKSYGGMFGGAALALVCLAIIFGIIGIL